MRKNKWVFKRGGIAGLVLGDYYALGPAGAQSAALASQGRFRPLLDMGVGWPGS